MSRTKIVLAGEGGQGVQSIAKILVEAGYEAGKQVLYIPNFGGIVLSAKQLRIMQSLCVGIIDAYAAYAENATDYQMQRWNEEFKWFFIRKAFGKMKYLDSDADQDVARNCLCELNKSGALARPPYKWAIEVQNEILEMIKDK